VFTSRGWRGVSFVGQCPCPGGGVYPAQSARVPGYRAVGGLHWHTSAAGYESVVRGWRRLCERSLVYHARIRGTAASAGFCTATRLAGVGYRRGVDHVDPGGDVDPPGGAGAVGKTGRPPAVLLSGTQCQALAPAVIPAASLASRLSKSTLELCASCLHMPGSMKAFASPCSRLSNRSNRFETPGWGVNRISQGRPATVAKI